MEKSSVGNWWARLKRFLLDAFFPIECLGCGREGQFLCALCFERIPEKEYQECPLCRHPYTQAGAVCRKCHRRSALDGLLVATPYQIPLVKDTIQTLKYRFIPGLAEPLSRLIVRALDRNSLSLPDVLVPVPLHPRRLRYRGFNQAELLARALATHLAPGLEIPVLEPILRTRFTKPQMKTVSKKERTQNLTGAFDIKLEVAGPIVGKYVWLIDDVATTGTTLLECAKALKSAGATTVWVSLWPDKADWAKAFLDSTNASRGSYLK